MHDIIWNSKNGSGNEVASGIYFYQIKTHNHNIIIKMELLK